MKNKFDLIYESIMSSIIKQGGHAVENVSKIKRENINSTINYLKQLIFQPLNISDNQWTAQIGSTGKKDQSGDIDIAINLQDIKNTLQLKDISQVKDLIIAKLKENNIQYTLKNGINLRFPIIGMSQQGQFVQIDLFTSTNLQYTKFSKFSPAQNESKYKGALRTNLLQVIIKHATIAAAETHLDKGVYTTPDGITYPASVFKQFALTDDGLFQHYKTFQGKNGKYLKNPKKMQDKTKLIAKTPQQTLDIIFGKNKYTVADCNSFQTIWNNILWDKDFPYKDKRKDIILNAYNLLTNNGIDIPEQIQQYMDDNNL